MRLCRTCCGLGGCCALWASRRLGCPWCAQWIFDVGICRGRPQHRCRVRICFAALGANVTRVRIKSTCFVGVSVCFLFCGSFPVLPFVSLFIGGSNRVWPFWLLGWLVRIRGSFSVRFLFCGSCLFCLLPPPIVLLFCSNLFVPARAGSCRFVHLFVPVRTGLCRFVPVRTCSYRHRLVPVRTY